jgi:hypothetical protein
MIKSAGRMSGLMLMALCITVASVSAYVYQQSQLSITQNIKEISTFSLTSSALGDIDEGQTIAYTKTDVAQLGDAIVITTTKSPVYLHISTNLAAQATNYQTYEIVVKYETVPNGGTGVSGDSVFTLSISNPTNTVTLDAAGTWKFDLEVTTTAKSVNADTPTTVTLTTTAESS